MGGCDPETERQENVRKHRLYFLEQVENSMTNVKNELDKLISYTEGREEIVRDDIDAVCSVQVTGRIFQMMDAVASGNQGRLCVCIMIF